MKNSLIRNHCAARLLSVVFVLGLAASSACAYTLVLRDGRHLEIPSSFNVTATAVTYELAPGFQKSLMMAVIDVPATERANNEQPGSLLRRSGLSRSPGEVQTNATARRSITNRDLQQYAATRKQHEQAFDERQKELGLPTLQELREQRRQQDEREFQDLKERLARMEAENQAAQVRTELATLQAELSSLRGSIDSSSSFSNAGFFPYGNYFPFGTGFFPSRLRDFNQFGLSGVRNNNLLFATGHPRRFVSPRGVVPTATRFPSGGRPGGGMGMGGGGRRR
jgi:hypothetical protein